MQTTTHEISEHEYQVLIWWGGLTDQERIVWALRENEIGNLWAGADQPSYVAEKPWKWANEAYDLAHSPEWTNVQA